MLEKIVLSISIFIIISIVMAVALKRKKRSKLWRIEKPNGEVLRACLKDPREAEEIREKEYPHGIIKCR